MQRAGVVAIVNAASSSFADMLSSFSITDVKRQVVLLHSTPCMLKQTFVFRAPALVSATWQFVLSLMKQKARERVTFVDSIEELARELGEGALTSDFGGSYEFDWDAWVQEKIEHEEQEEKRRALMALRRPLARGARRSPGAGKPTSSSSKKKA